MSAPVKIPIQYKAGDADVTFHVRSDKPGKSAIAHVPAVTRAMGRKRI